MKKHIKFASVLLCSSLLAIAASGCSSSKASTSTTKSSGDKTASSKPLSVQIESWTDTLPQKDGPFEQQIEKKANLKFDVSWIPFNKYADRYNVELASGNIPDISVIQMQDGQLFSPQLIQAINAGKFKDLSKYIDAKDFAKKYPHLAAYDKKIWDMIKFNGKTYALPAYINPIAGVGSVIIRQDLWQKAGLSEPTNLDEFADDLITIHNKLGVYGLETLTNNMNDKAYKSLEVAFTGVQDWKVDKNGNFTYNVFMPEYDKFLTWMQKLYKAGAIDPEYSMQQNGSSFKDAKSAAKVLNWWSWEQAAKTSKSPFTPEVLAKNPNIRAWGLLPLKGPKGYTVTVNPFSWPVMISSKVPDSEIPKILKFMDYTASKEYYDSTQLGVKGIDYTIQNGKPVVNPDKMKQTADNVYATVFENYPMDTKFLLDQAKERGVSDEDIQQMKKQDDAAVKAMNKMNLSEPTWQVASPTYFQKWSSLTNNLNTNENKVIMGQMSIDDWDKYVQSIVKSPDYQQIVKEYKKAYKAIK